MADLSLHGSFPNLYSRTPIPKTGSEGEQALEYLQLEGGDSRPPRPSPFPAPPPADPPELRGKAGEPADAGRGTAHAQWPDLLQVARRKGFFFGCQSRTPAPGQRKPGRAFGFLQWDPPSLSVPLGTRAAGRQPRAARPAGSGTRRAGEGACGGIAVARDCPRRFGQPSSAGPSVGGQSGGTGELAGWEQRARLPATPSRRAPASAPHLPPPRPRALESRLWP